MDRRGDGILTRDEFNQMAWTAVHNNPLVNPGFQNASAAPTGQYTSGPSMAVPSSKIGPYPSSAGLAGTLHPATGAVTFGGMTFTAPPASHPASGHANSWGPSVLGATSSGQPSSGHAAASWTPLPNPSSAPPSSHPASGHA